MINEIEITVPIEKIKDNDYVRRLCAKSLNVDLCELNGVVVRKRSIDARGGEIVYRVKCEVYLGDSQVVDSKIEHDYKYVENSAAVIVVGAGPAGIFASLRLLERGLKPVILERGKDVHARKVDIANMMRSNVVNSDSNYCFGEGGAGTFSDGKLFTRSTKRGNVSEVLDILVDHGADTDIMIDSHPHIGTDKLPGIMENMRHKIEEHGGEYHFNSRVKDFVLKNGEIKGVIDQHGDVYEGIAVILATGHSSRDIYNLLRGKGIAIEAKGFAMGVRLEHPQQLIDEIQYHGNKQRLQLPTASYNVVTQIDGRGVFSFCMCPGGIIVPAMTDEGELVVNGMSNSRRNSPYANTGMVVSVMPEDLKGYERYGELSCLKFQQDVEHNFFDSTNRTLLAPAQRMTDFVKGKISSSIRQCTYRPGVVSAALHEMLPLFISSRMRKAFPLFDRKMRGFLTSEALLVGLESRTSSAIRILRDSETLESVSVKRLYPCGEGAGYSGGIVSSAIDGMNVAEKIYL